MNSEIANENIQLLKDLEPFIKLKADFEGRLTFEDRYFSQVRRAITNDSREQLLSLLKQTFELSEESDDVKFNLLGNLRSVLSQTYPGYTPLEDVFDELIACAGGEKGDETNHVIEEPILLFDLDSLNLKRSDLNTHHVSMTENGLYVLTNKSRNGYLLSSRPISVSGLKQLHVTFQVNINKGGLGIGLLDTNGNWIPNCYKNFSRRSHIQQGDIKLPIEIDSENIMLVFYNCCSPAGISEFTIEQVHCYGDY